MNVNSRSLVAYFKSLLARRQGQYSAEFVSGMSRALAIVRNPRTVLFNTATHIGDMLERFANVRATFVATTDSFRNIIADSDFTIQAAGLGLIPDEKREIAGVMLRLATIYTNARSTGVMENGSQKKFQVRFGAFTSPMYFIANDRELKNALFDILIKYHEQLNWFQDEQYNVGREHRQNLRETIVEIDAVLDGELGEITEERRAELLEWRAETLERLDNQANLDLNLDAPLPRNAVELTTSATFIQYRGIRGGEIPDGLVLPKEISRSVINVNFEGGYCFFDCLDVALVYFLKKYDKFSHYASVEKNPELLTPTFSEQELASFYNSEGAFIFSPENIAKAEGMYGVNINLYELVLGKSGTYGIRCCYRSRFTVDQEQDVARILFVPYSMMDVAPQIRGKKRIAELTEKYSLGAEAVEQAFGVDGHFVLIPETSQLLCSKAGAEQNKTVYCPYCDAPFDAQDGAMETFTQHKIHCKIMINRRSNEDRLCVFKDNDPDSTVEFKNWYQLSKQPWICYADTETVTCNAEGNFQKHQLIAYMLNVVCSFDPSLSYQVMRSAATQEEMDGLLKQFARDIFQMRVYTREHSQKYPLIKMNDREKFLVDFYNNPESKTTCLFCDCQLKINLDFDDELDFFDEMLSVAEEQEKVLEKHRKKIKWDDVENESPHLHHDHNTGKIIGFLCQRCNKNERASQTTVSVAFHNLPYDLLVLIESFAENTFDDITYRGNTYNSVQTENKLSVIAQSGQKYSTISIHAEKVYVGRFPVYLPTVKFIDTFRFITKGLASIVETLKDGETCQEKLKVTFKHTWEYLLKTYGKDTAEALFPYSTQKGLIAYDAINLENLKSKTNLPKEAYKNSLSLVDPLEENSRTARYEAAAESEKASLEKDYARTQEVYGVLSKHFGEGMLYRQYFNFYLELDIMLLSDYFESLREQLIASHKLDPAYHTGLAGYSQNCMLYSTKSVLHLIEPVELSKLIIDNTRGGYSGIMKRISENFDGDKKKLIKYYDVNNLYGYGMTQKLANKYVGEITLDEFEKERGGDDFCYFLLTDYKVPEEIHDKLAKFPPLISKKTVVGTEVSSENKTIKEIKPTSCATKLCATLEDGQDYLMDSENYDFYERMGYDITIKRVFKFEQQYILKEYIDKNSALRQKSKTAIAKQLYKDLNNICYGKSLQNPMKYSNIELLSSEKQVRNRIRDPLLKRLDVIVNDKLVLSDLYHAEMKFNTCIQYGFHILEKSKLLMYRSLYEKIVPFCEKENVEWSLLMHDTDSFCFEFLLHDSRFANEKEFTLALHAAEGELFDLHMYADKDICDSSRKKVVGYFLDEYSDNFEVVGFVGLAAKSYCYILKDVRERDADGNSITKLYAGDSLDKMKFGETTTKIKGKGMRNSYLEALFEYEDYKKISQEGKIEDNNVAFRNIMKKNFGNTIETVNKVALSSYDDKWHIYKDDTGEHKYLPYGHYKIEELE